MQTNCQPCRRENYRSFKGKTKNYGFTRMEKNLNNVIVVGL